MTTTVVFAASGDGYLYSSAATHAGALAGTGTTAFTSVTAGFFGQNNNAGSYSAFETFIRFTYSAIPATEVLTSAAVQVRIASMLSPGISRSLEFRTSVWSPGGLTAADWLNASALPARALQADISGVNAAAANTRTRAGSDALAATVAAGSSVELVVASDRQAAGIAPAGDEGGSIYLSGAAGTTNDPALIFTTVPRSRMYGVLGAQTQFPDETWAYLENTGSAVELKYANGTGAVTTIGTIPFGTTTGTFAALVGAQSLALTSDPAGNLYVAGRFGAAAGSVAVLPYRRTGPTAWTANPMRTAALPVHSASINQVAVAYAEVPAAIITVLAARSTGTAYAASTPDTAWATFATSTLVGIGVGSIPLAVGDASGILDTTAPSGDFGGHRNEVGSGLDITESPDNPGWLYATSFHRGQVPGDNRAQSLGRLVTDSGGGAVTYQGRSGIASYGVKDASAKLRAVAASGSVAALVTADRDAGYGIGVYLYQHLTPPNAPVPLAGIVMAGESIPSMPDGPAVGTALTWDVAYSGLDNRMWIYYVDATNPLRVRRTPVSLDSYTATRQEVTVYTAPAGSTIQAIRVPRGARMSNRTLLQVAYSNGGANLLANTVDTYNVAPTPPTLSVRAGFDATQAATFVWTFNDPNPGDTQSAYQLQIEDAAAPGVAVVDTGKVVSTSSTRVVAGGMLTNAKNYQWRVTTWDALDTPGTYSTYSAFSTAAGGTVTITSPAADNPPGVATDEYQVTWSAAGTVQSAYRVWLYQGATQVSDSGWIISTAQTHLVTGMVSDLQHEIRVQVRNAAAVTSNTGTRLLTPSYGTPETPVVTVTPLPEAGHIAVAVSNPAPGQVAGSTPEFAFEPGMSLAGWQTGGATFALSTDQAYRGTGSGKVTATGGIPADVRAPNVAVVPGERYTVRFWAYTAVARTISAIIDWRTSGGTPVAGAPSAFANFAVPAGAWTLCRATGSVPAGCAQVAYGLALFAVTPTAGDVVYMDDLLLSPASDRPETATNEIYRRTVGGVWEMIGTCPPDSTYRDYCATSGVAYEYKARAVS